MRDRGGAEAAVPDERARLGVGGADVLAAQALIVGQVVELREYRDDVDDGHEAPDQVRHVILRQVTCVDRLVVPLHRIDAAAHRKALLEPRRRVGPLHRAQLVVDSQTLERHRGQQVDPAALDRKLGERRLHLRVVRLVRVPHDVRRQVLSVKRLPVRAPLLWRVLAAAELEPVDLRGRHREPRRHEEKVAAVGRAEPLGLGLEEERVRHVGVVPVVKARPVA
mmetsp:Transcript_82114/g.246147  ORF Transcript_82114/g.246147 Transcript_82114/m.246147 type:complete len:223 (+) Transcript_82114:455-1123(+)